MILKTYNENIDKFIEFVKTQTEQNGVKFVVSLVDYLIYDKKETKVNGYFLEKDEIYDCPVLAISTGKPLDNWFSILVHEFCHMQQWKYKKELWDSYIKSIAGGELDSELSDLTETRNLELDCEKEVCKLIEQYNLPIDKKEYIKKSNAYVLFYNYIIKHNKWYSIGREPYNIPEVFNKMSDEFDMDYENLDEEIENLFTRCCF